MSEERYIELINMELDGEISRSERQELEVYLASHPEAQQFYDQMMGMDVLLRRTQQFQPPADLKRAVLRDIAGRDVSPAQPRRSPGLSGSIVSAPAFRYAVSLAAGIVIGICIYAATSGEFTGGAPQTPWGVSGAILRGDLIDEARILGAEAFALAGSNGHLSLEALPGLVLARFEVQSDDLVKIEFAYPGERMQFSGYVSRLGRLSSVMPSDGRLRLEHAGANQYILLFTGSLQQSEMLNLQIDYRGQTRQLQITAGGGEGEGE